MPAVTDILETRMSLVGEASYTSGVNRGASAMASLGQAESRRLEGLRKMQAGSAAAALGIGAALKGFVDAAADLERTTLAFETLMGSAEAARTEVKTLQEMAAKTPFQFKDLAGATKQLIATGMSADRAHKIILGLGEGIASIGGDSQTFSGALNQVAQGLRKGKLEYEDLKIIAENGIPVFKVLAKELGITEQKAQKIGQSGRDVNEVVDALARGLSKQFGGSMDKQSRILTGSISSLKDNVAILSAELGAPLVGPINTATHAVIQMTDSLRNAPQWVKGLVTAVGVGAVGALGAYVIGVNLAIFRTLKLAEAHLTAAGAASVHARAEGGLAGTLGVGGFAGMGKRIGGMASRFGGPAAALGGIGLEMAGGEGVDPMSRIMRIGGSALTGAGIGGMIGRGAPGALAGAMLGALVGILKEGALNKGRTESAGQGKSGSEVEKLLREQNEILKKMSGQTGLPVDAAIMPAAAQLKALARTIG